MTKPIEELLTELHAKDLETLEQVANGDEGYLNNMCTLVLMENELIEPNRPGINFRLTEKGVAFREALAAQPAS